MCESILSNEKIHVDKQILLNNGKPFNSISDVYAYLDDMKEKLGDNMFIYDYNNLSEVLLNDISFNIFNNEIEKLNSDEANILNFYKIIGKRVYITEEKVNRQIKKIINYPYASYASCIIGLYKPNDTKNLLYSLNKNKNVYYNVEYTILSNNIKEINDVSIKNAFINWLGFSSEQAKNIQSVNRDGIKYEIYDYSSK